MLDSEYRWQGQSGGASSCIWLHLGKILQGQDTLRTCRVRVPRPLRPLCSVEPTRALLRPHPHRQPSPRPTSTAAAPSRSPLPIRQQGALPPAARRQMPSPVAHDGTSASGAARERGRPRAAPPPRYADCVPRLRKKHRPARARARALDKD